MIISDTIHINDVIHVVLSVWLSILTYILLSHRKRNRMRWTRIDDLVEAIELKIAALRAKRKNEIQ